MPEPTAAVLEERIAGLVRTLAEHDRRYAEAAAYDREAVRLARSVAENAAAELKSALTDYKRESNEWRGTVEGLVAQLRLLGETLAEMRQQLKALERSSQEWRDYRSGEAGEDVARKTNRTDRLALRSVLVSVGVFVAGSVVTIILFLLSL